MYIEIFDGPSTEIPDRSHQLIDKYRDNVVIQDLLTFINEKPDRHLCLPSEESIIK